MIIPETESLSLGSFSAIEFDPNNVWVWGYNKTMYTILCYCSKKRSRVIVQNLNE